MSQHNGGNEGDDGFRDLIVQTARCTLDMVQASGAQLETAEQEQIKSILGYALRLERAWDVARQLLLLATPLMEMKGERRDWIEYLEWAIKICQRRADRSSLALLQYHNSLLYRLLGEFATAWHYANAAVDNFSEEGNLRKQAVALAERAWVEQLQGDYASATASVQQALYLLLAHSSDEAQDPEVSNCYRVLGTIALNQADYPTAEQYYRLALTRLQQQGDQRRMAWGLHNLGLVLNRQKQYQAAIPYFQQAAALMEEVGDSYHLAHAYFNWGEAHIQLGEAQEALHCYRWAIPIYQELDDKFRLSLIQTDVGLALLRLGNPAAASHAFEASVKLAIVLKADFWRLNAMDGLGDAYTQNHEAKKALVVLEGAIRDLPLIYNHPNYTELAASLALHLEAARRSLDDDEG
ncbi:MAG: tetratricopeptide repeat protein [Caldilineaceae bacterium]